MRWETTKPATENGELLPVGTRGEGDVVPAHLVGKVRVLITATPSAETEADEAEAKAKAKNK